MHGESLTPARPDMESAVRGSSGEAAMAAGSQCAILSSPPPQRPPRLAFRIGWPGPGRCAAVYPFLGLCALTNEIESDIAILANEMAGCSILYTAKRSR